MKKLLLILLCFPMIGFGQYPESVLSTGSIKYQEQIFIYFFISVIIFILFTFSIYRIADNLDKAGYELNNTSLSKAGRILMWLVAILVILFFISLIYLFFLLS